MLCGPSNSKQRLLVINSDKFETFLFIIKFYQIIWLILINNICDTIVQGYTSHFFLQKARDWVNIHTPLATFHPYFSSLLVTTAVNTHTHTSNLCTLLWLPGIFIPVSMWKTQMEVEKGMETIQFFFPPFPWVGIERWSEYSLCRTAFSRDYLGSPHTCYDSATNAQTHPGCAHHSSERSPLMV